MIGDICPHMWAKGEQRISIDGAGRGRPGEVSRTRMHSRQIIERHVTSEVC